MQNRLVINGALVEGARKLDVIDPATGEVFASCACADAKQMDEAIAAARAAFPDWADTADDVRSRMLRDLEQRLTSDAESLARLLTKEQGKPFGDAMGEVMASAAMLRYFADFDMKDEVVCDDDNAHIVVHRAPLGVVAIITPWNSPVLMLVNKIAPALRVGNSVVCKPAATTPLTTLAIGAICSEIFPAGVVNVVADANDLGEQLTSSPDIAKISFTGSTATGSKVMASASGCITPLTLELGGNDAAIVLDDADVDAVAPQILNAAMRNAGQVCLATKRAYVPNALYDPMCRALARLAEQIVVGSGLEEGVTMGPIQNRSQYEKVCAFLEIAHRDGKVIAGGTALDSPGNFIAPTVVRDIPPDSALVTEEQFGPILPVIRYGDIDAVIAQVNASPFGLGGTIWCRNVARGIELAERIESGIIWVNKYMDLRFDVPIGGVKSSGMGVEMGREGIESYTRRTVINSRPAADSAGNG